VVCGWVGDSFGTRRRLCGLVMSRPDGRDVDKLDKFGLSSGFCCTIESNSP
jgi:hypothetical protein